MRVWSDTPDGMDWQELTDLYHAAPLGKKDPDQLQTVYSNSRYCSFVREQGRLIAAGRVLADGRDCAYICDLAVHPDYQGQGLGREVLSKLLEASRGHAKIILYAVPGKEGFYEKMGFRKMTTAMAIFADQEQAAANGLILDSA